MPNAKEKRLCSILHYKRTEEYLNGRICKAHQVIRFF